MNHMPRCTILITPPPNFPMHRRGIHKWNTHLCTPPGLHNISLGMYCVTHVRCTGMGQVFTFARGGVVEYCTSQNATLASILSRFLTLGLVFRYRRTLMARLHWCESDIASRWVHKKSNLMFTLSSDKDQSKKFAFVFALAQCE